MLSISRRYGRGYVASTLYARARAYREFDRQSELALGDLGRHEAVAVRKKRSRRVPLDDAETSEEAVRSTPPSGYYSETRDGGRQRLGSSHSGSWIYCGYIRASGKAIGMDV